MPRMEEDMLDAGPTEKSHGWGSHVIEYFALGAAIIATRADHQIPTPQLVLPMVDK